MHKRITPVSVGAKMVTTSMSANVSIKSVASSASLKMEIESRTLRGSLSTSASDWQSEVTAQNKELV